MEVGAAPICAAPRHDDLERENMQPPSLNPQHALEHMHTTGPASVHVNPGLTHARTLLIKS